MSEKNARAFRTLGLGGFSQQRASSLQDKIGHYYTIQAEQGIDVIAFWKVSASKFYLLKYPSKILQDHKDKFPTLFRLAMDILPIQASSVPCERIFSSSKETTTARRNKLHPNLVEALQVLKFGRKNAPPLSFTEGLDSDIEVSKMEAYEEIQPTDDLCTYLQSFTRS
jgi:hypothetical protein